MKSYEQPIIRLRVFAAQDVLTASNPEWQDDPFTDGAEPAEAEGGIFQ